MVKAQNKEDPLSIDPKKGQTMDRYMKERVEKLHADGQSRSPELRTCAEP